MSPAWNASQTLLPSMPILPGNPHRVAISSRRAAARGWWAARHVRNGLDIENENVHIETAAYFCCQLPLLPMYHQPPGALSTQRRAKVWRISPSHSGWPLALAISA